MQVWEIAAALHIKSFVPERGPAVRDDHIPFLRLGIPAIDLVDLDYPYWHTSQDTPDKCSPDSLDDVGRVLVQLIYAETRPAPLLSVGASIQNFDAILLIGMRESC
ncbi:MAG: M28 family peptidase [Candidatus Aminicenantales bacterium]